MKKFAITIFSLALVAVAGNVFAQAVPADGWYFYSAGWCPDCKSVANAFKMPYEDFSQSLKGNVLYANADSHGAAASSLIYDNNISSLPTLVEIKGGKVNVAGQVTGVDNIVTKMKELGVGQEELEDQGKKISVTTDWVWDQNPLHPKTSPASYYNANLDNDVVAARRPGESSSQAETKKITEDKQKELSINATAHQQRYVTLGGVKVGPGEYTVGPACQLNTYPQGNTTKGVRLTEWDEGAFKECDMPTAGADASQSGFGNVGNGTNLFGSPGAPGGPLGANSLLPALLSGLLGQGFGGGGLGNQNNQGNPAVNNNVLACDQQGTSPVCGEDGKTYNNSCYMSQARVTLKSQGVCASPSPSPTPNTSAILTQLSASGVPSGLLDAVRNVVASVLSNILSGTTAVAETVVK